MSRQYEPGTGLGKHREGILEPILIKGQDSTFGLGLKPTRKDFLAMIAQRKERRRARTTWQVTDAPIEIPHLSETFWAPNYAPQFPEQQGEGPDPASIDSISSKHVATPAIEEVTDPFADMQDGIFVIERDLVTPSLLFFCLLIVFQVGSGSRSQL